MIGGDGGDGGDGSGEGEGGEGECDLWGNWGELKSDEAKRPVYVFLKKSYKTLKNDLQKMAHTVVEGGYS